MEANSIKKHEVSHDGINIQGGCHLDGRVYVFTKDGLYSLDEQTGEISKELINANEDLSRVSAAVSIGSMGYCACPDGVYQFDLNNLSQQSERLTREASMVTGATVLGHYNGLIYAITQNGLYSVDPSNQGEEVCINESLVSKNVTDACIDSNGFLMIHETSGQMKVWDLKT